MGRTEAERREANRDRQRRYRERQREARAAEYQRYQSDGEQGSVRTAVLADLEHCPLAHERPADAACALRMAELLDNPAAVGLWPQASKRLQDLMGSLRKGQAVSETPLANLRARRTHLRLVEN